MNWKSLTPTKFASWMSRCRRRSRIDAKRPQKKYSVCGEGSRPSNSRSLNGQPSSFLLAESSDRLLVVTPTKLPLLSFRSRLTRMDISNYSSCVCTAGTVHFRLPRRDEKGWLFLV